MGEVSNFENFPLVSLADTLDASRSNGTSWKQARTWVFESLDGDAIKKKK